MPKRKLANSGEERRASRVWALAVSALAFGCVVFLGSTMVWREDELQSVREPLASECVRNGYVFNALRQVCTEIVDGESPDEEVPVVPPESPVERFPSAPETPIPTLALPPSESNSGPVTTLPAQPPPAVTLTNQPGAPVTVVTTSVQPPITVIETQPAPPPETVTEPAPPPETVTVTQPPETVTETVTQPPPPPVTETVTEPVGPPPIIGVN